MLLCSRSPHALKHARWTRAVRARQPPSSFRYPQRFEGWVGRWRRGVCYGAHLAGLTSEIYEAGCQKGGWYVALVLAHPASEKMLGGRAQE